MKTRIKIPRGWHRLRVGTVIREGDLFKNCSGMWIRTSDAGSRVQRDYLCYSEFPEYSGVYIRRNKSHTYLPCPFCGGSISDLSLYVDDHGAHRVSCVHCGGTGPRETYPSLARQAWNRRK